VGTNTNEWVKIKYDDEIKSNAEEFIIKANAKHNNKIPNFFMIKNL
jgi:hypothetical protein